jgi:thioredoxin|tara:strand:+ start:142 stop:465 length:324 start_codon:yes stop_codon:yes gene_type:complete
MPAPVKLADKAAFDAALADAGDKLVVVDFTASWCGPCQRIAPVFAKMAEEMEDVVFVKVDVDENEEVAAECDISAMPTFQFYKRKAMVHEFSGASEESIRKAIVANK